jgi:hypothetical protein
MKDEGAPTPKQDHGADDDMPFFLRAAGLDSAPEGGKKEDADPP